MALAAAGVLALPDIACLGVVTKIDTPYLSKKGVYHVLPMVVTGKYAAPKQTTSFFIFEPRWFGDNFDPIQVLINEEGDQKKYGNYRRTINGGRNAVLQALLGSKFDAFAAEFNGNDEPTEEDVARALRTHLLGEEVLCVMTQRVDEGGELMEQYNIKQFYAITDENLSYLVEQSHNEGRKTPLVVTWDE